MAETFEVDQENKETIYTFCFGISKESIKITQQQLDLFPYLATLVAHTDDFASTQNENGEYVLNSQIRYNWFIPIFQSIVTKHPSALLTELPREANIWGMLQLYDYLCISPLPIPVLKDQHLVRLNSSHITNEKLCVKYRRVNNLLEVRDTAVEFIIAISKNEYNLDDSNTLNSIYSLIMIILSNLNIFGLRLCHHTLTVVKKYCFSFFSYKGKRQLNNVQEYIQNIKAKSFKYLCNDDQELPENFQNAFAWKYFFVAIEENDNADRGLNFDKKFIHYETIRRFNLNPLLDRLLADNLFFPYYEPIFTIENFDLPIEYEYMGRIIPYTRHVLDERNSPFLEQIREQAKRQEEHNLWLSLRSSMGESNLYELLPVLRVRASSIIDNPDDKELHIYQIKQELKKKEARAARSGRFNTLTKRPYFDKLKHRSGPKTGEYR